MQLRKQCKFDLGYKRYKLQGNPKMTALAVIIRMAPPDVNKLTIVPVDTRLTISANLSNWTAL